MPAGTATAFNTAAVWTDLVKLSPMVWAEGARVGMEELLPVMDIYDNDQLDQFNRDYSYIASSGFGRKIDEGGDYQTRTNNQGDTLSLSVIKRGDAFTITEDLVDGNKYREIRLGMEDLGGSLFRTMARDGTHHTFTFGFSTSYTDADGKTVTNGVANATTEAKFADTHTMADGSTYDNNLADTAIGESSLRSIQNLTVNFVDENGNRVSWGRGGKLLAHGPDVAMEQAAIRLTEQEWNYNSTNRDMNVFRGAYRRVKLFYLDTNASGQPDTTKAKYYFILDAKLAKDSCIFGIHTRPTPKGPYEDMFNGGMLWRSKCRYDIGAIYSHFGCGCPATT